MVKTIETYLDVADEFIKVKVTGTAVGPIVNLFKDFFMTFIKDAVISALQPVFDRSLPNAINGNDNLKQALTELNNGYVFDW